MFELTNGCALLFTGHMAQMGKKNLTLLQTLRKEKAARAKAVGSTEVPNLQESFWLTCMCTGEQRGRLRCRPGPARERT